MRLQGSEPDGRRDRSDFAGRAYWPYVARHRHRLPPRRRRAAARPHGHRHDVDYDPQARAVAAAIARGDRSLSGADFDLSATNAFPLDLIGGEKTLFEGD